MRKVVKLASTKVDSLNPEMSTARYENTKTKSMIGDDLYKTLGSYSGIKTTNYKTDGNVELAQFREALIGLRTQLKRFVPTGIPGGQISDGDNYGFTIHLKVENEENSEEPYYIQVVIYRKVVVTTNREDPDDIEYSMGDDEYGRILVTTTLESEIGDYYYGMNELIVDSDIDDRIWRFVGQNEWRSTTYLILDLNKNLSINKGAYLTLNLPFNNNISWYDPIRKTVISWYCDNQMEKLI